MWVQIPPSLPFKILKIMTYQDFIEGNETKKVVTTITSKEEYLSTWDNMKAFEDAYEPTQDDWKWAEKAINDIIDEVHEYKDEIEEYAQVTDWSYFYSPGTVKIEEVVSTIRDNFKEICVKHNGCCTISTGRVKMRMNIIARILSVDICITELNYEE
jgi:hypothetical protein